MQTTVVASVAPDGVAKVSLARDYGATGPPNVDYLDEAETTDSSGPPTPPLYSTVPIEVSPSQSVLAYSPTSAARKCDTKFGDVLHDEVFTYGLTKRTEALFATIPKPPVLSYGPSGMPKAIAGTTLPEPANPILSYGPVSSPKQRALAAASVAAATALAAAAVPSEDPVLSYSPPASTHQKAVLCYGPSGSPNHIQHEGLQKLLEPATVVVLDDEFENLQQPLLDPTLPTKKVLSIKDMRAAVACARVYKVDPYTPLKKQVSNFLLAEPWKPSRDYRTNFLSSALFH